MIVRRTHNAAMSLLACALMPACPVERPADSPQEPAPRVRVEDDAVLRETHYAVADGPCSVTWTVYRTEVNRGVIRHRANCDWPLADQAPLIADLLREVEESEPGASHFHTLAWGRLHPDGAGDVTMPMRLALAAINAEEWDADRGAPRSGDFNTWVRELANDAMIYGELQSVFRDAGLDIRVASVEKVLVMPAGELPFFDALHAQGVQPDEKLPYDCQAWFSVGPIKETD